MSSTLKPYDIARILAGIYSDTNKDKKNKITLIDKNKITPEQQRIIDDLKNYPDDNLERRNDKIDYFYKRINNINETFMINKITIDKNPDIIMPRPIFNIFQYDDCSLIKLLGILIENNIKEKNRKDKHNLYKKIDIDKDSSEVIDIVNKISDKEYRTFEYIKSNYEISNLEILWSHLNKVVKYEYATEISYYNIEYRPEDINLEMKTTTYTKVWEDCFRNVIKDFKKGYDNQYMQLQIISPLYPIITYKIIWNLWIRIINKIFQQICIHYYKKEESINSLIDTLNLLVQEIEKDKEMVQKEKDIADGYYKYYYMLEISSVLDMELICLNFINKKDYMVLREEDLFVDEKNNIKEEFLDIDKIKIDELNRLFNVGEKCPKKDTFETRLKFCKDFIPIYNILAHRNIKENNIINLRAVYRALFINKITYKRLKTYGIAKKIIELFEKTKKYNTNNPDNPDNRENMYKNILNDIYREDINLKKHHFILGNAISNAILLEQIYGYNTMKFKCRFLEIFYKLALLIFYRDCPRMDAGQEEIKNALNNIEYNFDKILKELLKIIEYNS